jgi:hypothetical protein
MSCLVCASHNHVEFLAQMVVHLDGLTNLNNPGVQVSPKLLVCLDCGFARFSIPRPELGLLAVDSQTSDRFVVTCLA